MSTQARIRITRASPLVTVQDSGRFGALGYGVAASGPMDDAGWKRAGGASSGLEFTLSGLDFTVLDGRVSAGLAGGKFALAVNGKTRRWPARVVLKPGDDVVITPGKAGNYGYLRFDGDIDVPRVLGSRSTNTVAGLGGFNGRPLRAGDEFDIVAPDADPLPPIVAEETAPDAPLRFVWGLHADLFDSRQRNGFVTEPFVVSRRLDRMGVRLDDRTGVFSHARHLSLVSDAVVPGDVQILGDGTPIVLMRDHQPTGGYPRLATILTADLGRFAQMRPTAALRFAPVSLMGVSRHAKGGTAQ